MDTELDVDGSVLILDEATVAGAGPSHTMTGGGVETLEAYGTTSEGRGSAIIQIQVSNDGSTWQTAGTISLDLETNRTSNRLTMDSAWSGWTYIRSNLKSISGTGASVSVYKNDVISKGLAAELAALNYQPGGGAGILGYATLALLNADLARDDGNVALVTNDGTAANNTYYRKSGASGTGIWIAMSGTAFTSDSRGTHLELASPFMPGTQSVFRYIRKLTLYKANPSKFYTVRYFFYNDVGIRFNFTVSQADDAAGTNVADVCRFSSTGGVYSGLWEFTLTELSSSGMSGTLVVDFATSPANWTMTRGTGGATFATTVIRPDTLVTSTAETAYLNALTDLKVATATAATDVKLALSDTAKLPFVKTLNNDNLRKLVTDLVIYGGDPTHRYILSTVEVQSYRCKFELKDLDFPGGAHTVGFAAVTATITDYTTLKPVWRLDAKLAGDPKGLYAIVNIDWTQAVTGTGTYTLVTQSGIHPSKVRPEEAQSEFMTRDYWHEIIKVGAGQTYTTLRAAVESIYDAGKITCVRAHMGHQILIDLVVPGTYLATDLNIPSYVSIRGLGTDLTFIYKENSTQKAMLDLRQDTKLMNLTMLNDTGDGGAWEGNYCIHSDDNNVTAGPLADRRLRKKIESVKLLVTGQSTKWIYGAGVSSGEHIQFIDVEASHVGPTSSAAFGFHNTALSYAPSLVELVGCRSRNEWGQGAQVLSLGSGQRQRLRIVNSDLGLVQQGVTGSVADKAKDRFEWDITGNYEGPIEQVDEEMLVLQTTAGQSPTGSAAALIFGTTDELGRGDLCILTGSTFSLGARLGDCSSVNKDLTIGAQTYTFTANHTAQSNSTIIGLINAVITSNPVSEKRIDLEQYPDTGFTRSMLNSTGVTIPAGKFVKRTGVVTIALADGSDDVFGFVYRDILDGWKGNVVTSKRISYRYITGAVSDGKFGVTSGALDYGASTKIGYVNNGVVYRY